MFKSSRRSLDQICSSKKSLILQTFSRNSSFRIPFYGVLSSGLWNGFMNPPPSVFPNRERKSPQRGLGRSLERWRYSCDFPAPSWAPTCRKSLCCSQSDWSKLYKLYPIFCGPQSTLLHPVLASSFPLWQDFSKRASFPIVCVEWLYKKAVWVSVKSWEFEENLRCSKILGIRRKILWNELCPFTRLLRLPWWWWLLLLL